MTTDPGLLGDVNERIAKLEEGLTWKLANALHRIEQFEERLAFQELAMKKLRARIGAIDPGTKVVGGRKRR